MIFDSHFETVRCRTHLLHVDCFVKSVHDMLWDTVVM